MAQRTFCSLLRFHSFFPTVATAVSAGIVLSCNRYTYNPKSILIWLTCSTLKLQIAGEKGQVMFGKEWCLVSNPYNYSKYVSWSGRTCPECILVKMLGCFPGLTRIQSDLTLANSMPNTKQWKIPMIMWIYFNQVVGTTDPSKPSLSIYCLVLHNSYLNI